MPCSPIPYPMNTTQDGLRQAVVGLLEGGGAHVTLTDALVGLAPEWRTHRPPGLHSVWQLLEHLRTVQHDLLRYTLEPTWTSPDWPDETWPENPSSLPEAVWEEALAAYRCDLDELVALTQNPAYSLTAEIPHGEGRTYLRQLLLAADHAAYHIGQIVSLRRARGDWPPPGTPL